MSGTDWVPGLVVLGAALVAGAIFIARALVKPPPPPPGAGKDAAELDARYRAAIEQLKELKANQHQLDPAAFAAQWSELESRAADALRGKESQADPKSLDSARDERAPAAIPTRVAPPSGWFARHPELKGALWGGGVVAFFALVFVLLVREEKPQAPMNPPQPQAQAQAQTQAGTDELDVALAHVRQNPQDVEAAAAAGHELIRRQRWDEARSVTDRALGVSPFLVEHRIHRAVLAAVDGDRPGATAQLRRLADLYVDSHEALLFLASLVGEAGDTAGALDALERYASVAPPSEQPPQIYEAMAKLRSQLHPPNSP